VSVDVVSEVVIERPCERVAAFAGDPDQAPRWYENIESVEWRTPPPLQVGSRVAFVAHFLRRRLAYTYEIVDPFLAAAMRRANRKDLAKLKTLLEEESA
jgi:hypothetical protein